jgi:oligopeptide/dipeptide ABC transporter ATP-binding protein
VSTPLLRVRNLDVRFATGSGEAHAVRSLSFSLGERETLGIVGESGSGKSQTMLAIIGLLTSNGRATGSAQLAGRELIGMADADLADIRGARIAMIFQDPMTALNPYLTIGDQMSLVLRRHRREPRHAIRKACEAMLEAVRLPDAGRRLGMYPHQLSGGMRQRVMIAAALLCEPELLIADEPTTALDVTVQAQMLALLKELPARFGTSIILITHDLGVVAGIADRVLVMQAGVCREEGTAEQVLCSPKDPYTRALLAALPSRATEGGPLAAAGDVPVLLRAEGLQVSYRVRQGAWSSPQELVAVNDVSFELSAGETLAVVGESGCGKSTLGRAVLQLLRPNAGQVVFLGKPLVGLDEKAMSALRRDLQVVFQDPLASLDPRMTVHDIIAEPLERFAADLTAELHTHEVRASLSRVGLDDSHLYRYPHQLSGGQCQRVAIARALITRPRVVVCDEALSALDVTVQSQIVALLIGLQRELQLSLIFIAHDLAVVRRISHRVLVMYLGRVMEAGPAEALYREPRHPYTRALLAASPSADPRIERARPAPPIIGDVRSPLNPPSGCVFRTRCDFAIPRCASEVPRLQPCGSAEVACHLASELPVSAGSVSSEHGASL